MDRCAAKCWSHDGGRGDSNRIELNVGEVVVGFVHDRRQCERLGPIPMRGWGRHLSSTFRQFVPWSGKRHSCMVRRNNKGGRSPPTSALAVGTSRAAAGERTGAQRLGRSCDARTRELADRASATGLLLREWSQPPRSQLRCVCTHCSGQHTTQHACFNAQVRSP